MKILFKTGDITEEPVDGLVCSGNVLLNMSGGVNGALLQKGGENLQIELHEYLKKNKLNFVQPGFVMKIGPDKFPFKCIVYCVAIDGFYESSIDMVKLTLNNALKILQVEGCKSIAIPALATGYGHLEKHDFAIALRETLDENSWTFREVKVILKNTDSLEIVKTAFNAN